MAKKKDEQVEIENEKVVTEEQQADNEIVIEAKATPITSNEAIKNRVVEIVNLFPLVGTIEGEKLNPEDPYHQIVAAFMVGKLGLLRRL